MLVVLGEGRSEKSSHTISLISISQLHLDFLSSQNFPLSISGIVCENMTVRLSNDLDHIIFLNDG